MNYRLTRCMGDCPNINVICKGCSFPDYVEEYEEKEMEKQKFQFESEEQFVQIMKRLGWQSPYIENDYLPIARREDLIRKSELQTLVDEAEKRYCSINWNCPNRDENDNLLEEFYRVIQALKKSHPEFKE